MDETGMRQSWSAREGSAFPLGATWIAAEDAYNFALYSKHATRVTLLLFREGDPGKPAVEVELDYRFNKSGRIWHCRLPLARMAGCCHYAY
ncbi:MAG: hypothetical protein V2I26_11365, partial [Halieaceae bacterium]|nr:hypothetical protein [Halieaceae bacterium]